MAWTINLFGLTLGLLDVITILVVVIFGLEGAIKGFIYKISSLTGIIIGIVAAILYTAYFKSVVLNYVTIEMTERNSILISLAVFVAICVITYLIIKILGNALRKVIVAIKLGFIDNTLGFIFGSFLSLTVISIICSLLTKQEFIDFSTLFNNSILYDDYIKSLFSNLTAYINV